VRVAIVGTELCALDQRGGGLERVVLRWAEALATAGHEVLRLSFAPAGPPLGDVITVERPSDLAHALRRAAPDLVSLHNRPQWGRLCPPGARVAVTFHNFPRAWRVRAGSWAGVRAAAPACRFSAVSGALAAAAADALGGPCEGVAVTPPSIDPAFVCPPPRAPARVVLSPNRLLRKKGVLDLLAVARRPGLRDVEFAFADLLSPWPAPTAEHRALRAAVARVRNASLFAPAATPADLAARYATAGVVACPAREPEGLGLVPLEAQACGAPVVTTDVGGLREATFPPNRCIPPGDRDALMVALIDALSTSAPQADARRSVLAQHSPNAAGATFLRWVAEAVP
jgi:glycosyltransferase involved in cell wall biosynthesis